MGRCHVVGISMIGIRIREFKREPAEVQKKAFRLLGLLPTKLQRRLNSEDSVDLANINTGYILLLRDKDNSFYAHQTWFLQFNRRHYNRVKKYEARIADRGNDRELRKRMFRFTYHLKYVGDCRKRELYRSASVP
jgi:hypothetical protein